MTFFAFSNILTVKLPVPGPTSRTMSEGLRFALATIASATPGFLRICWPTLVLNLKTLLVAACALEYGDELEAALLRFPCFSLPMAVYVEIDVVENSEMRWVVKPISDQGRRIWTFFTMAISLSDGSCAGSRLGSGSGNKSGEHLGKPTPESRADSPLPKTNFSSICR
jgi:hypothetical protein